MGAVCFLLWQRQGGCPTAATSNTPGAILLLSPGGPGYVNQPDDVPPALVGLVADNVRSVILLDQGTWTKLPIKHNVVFKEFDESPATAFATTVRLVYRDGSTAETRLYNSAPIHLG